MLHRKSILTVCQIVLLTLTIGLNQSAHALLNIPTAPIFLGGNIQPNIMFAVDDSGSMDWEVLLRAGAAGPNSGNLDISPNDFNEDRELCLGHNALAYNPDFTYVPWIGEDGNGVPFGNAIPTAARWNPYDPNEGTVNVVTQFGRSVLWGQWTDTDNDNEYDANECPTATVNGGGFGGRVFNDPRWVEVQSMGTAPDPRYLNEATGLTHSEQVNFANWYSYYRKREHVLKAVMGILIDDSTARMGLATLWNRNNVGTPIRDMTVDADKQDLVDEVYQINSSNGTPLRRLLNNVGRYYNSAESTPSALGFTEASPLLPAADGGECQQNFTVLMSDGFWNGGNPGVGNEDGDGNSIYDGGPHADNNSNTLADVAMRYYETDLDTGLGNNVPTITGVDENDAQHMVTYTVAFGLQGSGTLAGAGPFGAPIDHDPLTPAPPWTTPQANQNTTIDDMIHAAYNGRGLYLNAGSPGELIDSLSNALGNIEDRTSSSASTVSFNSGSLQSDSRFYAASFDATNFSGKVEAFDLSLDATNQVVSSLAWDASEEITPTTRGDFFTNVAKSGVDTPITFAQGDTELTNAVERPLGPGQSLIPGAAVIDYIRGEIPNAGTTGLEAIYGIDFRERPTDDDTGAIILMADIVAGSPIPVRDQDFGYDLLPGGEGSSYTAFLNSQQAQYVNELVLMVGTNGGVVHALSDNSGGEEIFAYVPRTVHENLHKLTEPTYTHEFFINAPGSVADARINGWQKLYVSALGEGGRGIFALNVTDPKDGTNPFLWEKNSDDRAEDIRYGELGFITHDPITVRLNNGDWGVVVGNGFNSDSERAQLFILDAADGSIIRVFDTLSGGPANTNGMAAPRVLDEDGDRIVDTIYAGDLNGNLWKIDVSSTNASNWDFAFGNAGSPQPMFTALDSANNELSITTRPSLAFHPEGGFMVLFGTGKFIEPNDVVIPSNAATDSFFGLRDNGATIPSNRGTLVEQNLSIIPGQPDAPRALTSNIVDYTSQQGWYVDFDIDAGERVIAQALVFTEIVVFVTFNPEDTPCGAGGTSYLVAADFLNGAATQGAVFDFDGDGIIDANDNIGGVVGSGKKLDGGVVGGLGTVITKSGDNLVLYRDTAGGGGGELVDEVDVIEGRTSWRQIK